MAILNNSNAISAGGYDVNNSLRFRSSASAYLSRTPASTGDRQKWTFSAWVKRGASGVRQGIFVANPSGAVYWGLEFETGNNLNIYDSNAGGTTALTTTALYRDFGAWYHVVVAVDTTQSTASNRVKLYINGTQVTAFSVANYPSQNSNTQINTGSLAHYIGNWNPSVANLPLDGYMAEVNFIDGSQKAASDFGETDTTTGVWKPKAYTGTYGTNGFYLKFSDIATTSGSNAGLGKDFSGNANYWTTNNISVTAGTTYDAMKDSPTNTSATVANYAVLNPLSNLGTAQTLSEGNLKLTNTSSTWGSKFSTIGVSSGKWYAEFTVLSASLNIVGVIADADTTITGTDKYLGNTANSYGYFHSNGNKFNNGTGSAYGASYTTNDVIGVALDMDNGTLTFYKNGTSQGTAYSSLSGVFYIGCSVSSASSSSFAANFGQRPFSYTPPTGFVALNTYNLPTPTILQGNKYMDATTWTGNNASPRSITNAGSFKPDLVWVKGRNGTINHILIDAVRGTSKNLTSNSTAAEVTSPVNGSVSAFNTDGFSVSSGSSDSVEVNYSVGGTTYTYVGWQWQAGQGTTSSNTQGSITSTVSVNATAGFSIVGWTSDGASAVKTMGHGLGVAPAMIIARRRDATGGTWVVYHKSLSIPNQRLLQLNSTSAEVNPGVGDYWSTSSTTFGLYQANICVNGNTAIAYCWADVSGFSKAFSYTGNGNADGPFVYLGFRPKFIMIKSSAGVADDWSITDTSRSTYNLCAASLRPNTSGAEDTNVGVGRVNLDILSNGFKLRQSSDIANGNGFTYIGMAWAENPFKNSNAR